MSYRDGSGEPLILIHGVASSWRDWGPVLPSLAARLDVIALGLPGHFGMPPFAAGTKPSVSAAVDEVERTLDSLGLGAPHIAGSSLGGWIAFELARRGRARSVAALAPAGLGEPAEARRLEVAVVRAHRLARVLAHFGPWLRRSRLAARVLMTGTVRDPSRVDPEAAVWKLRTFAGCPAFRDLVRDLCTRRLEGLEEVRCPTLVVWGERDRRLPVAQAARFAAALPRARVVLLPGAGHLPMWDEPDRVAALLSELALATDRFEESR